MSYKNLSISKKVGINVGIVTAALLVFMFFSVRYIQSIEDAAKLTRDESARFALLAKEAQLHVIQTQQWLTDIAATQAREGFDDGFKEAEKHAEGFRDVIGQFRAMFVAENDTENISFIDRLSADYDGFYTMGKQMADSYIKGGSEAGNVFMEKFDPFAVKVTDEIDQLVASQVNELSQNMDSIVVYTSRLFSFFIIAVLVVLAVNLLFGTVLAQGITRPLKHCIALARDIASSGGDLTRKLDLKRKDEIGVLADSFDDMVENIRKIMVIISEQSQQVAGSSEELLSTSMEMSSGSEELSVQASTTASATEEITASIASVSGTAAEMSGKAQAVSSSSESMSNHINTVASAIDEMSSSIQEVAVNCSKASTFSANALEKTDVSQKRMGELNQSAQEIGKVVEMITEITEQTKLLALNATIEAARAGEAGKGFAVVASEVKELAKQTASATEGIILQVRQIRERTGAVVEAIDEVAAINRNMNDVSNTIAAAVEEQSATMNDMARNVAQGADDAKSVTTDIQDLSVGISKNITAALQEASAGATEISSNIHGVNTVAQDFATGASAINGAAKDLSVLAQNLQTQVGRFKVE
ncbi:MAG: methyl-accepting chemotaxis protein [Pseudomonadota bacterium]